MIAPVPPKVCAWCRRWRRYGESEAGWCVWESVLTVESYGCDSFEEREEEE